MGYLDGFGLGLVVWIDFRVVFIDCGEVVYLLLFTVFGLLLCIVC